MQICCLRAILSITQVKTALLLVIGAVAFLLVGCTSADRPSTSVDLVFTPSVTMTRETTPAPSRTVKPSTTPVPLSTPNATATPTQSPTSTLTPSQIPLPSNTATPSPNLVSINPSNIHALQQLTRILEDVGGVALSPDSKNLATINSEGVLTIRDINDPFSPFVASSFEIPTTYQSGTFDAEYSVEGNEIAIGTADNTVLTVNTNSGHTSVKKWGLAWVMNVSYSPNGALLAASGADGYIRVWDKETSTLLFEQKTNESWDWVTGLDISPDNRKLASGSSSHFQINIWDIDTSERLLTLDEGRGGFNDLTFSPDGSLLLAGGCHLELCSKGFIALWETSDYEEFRVTGDGLGAITSVAFSEDGQLFATGTEEGKIWIWNTETQEVARVLAGHTAKVAHLAFGEDGLILASVGEDNAIFLWGIIED